ncbi:MAG: VOC family protein [Ilumatobacter sp.]|jgi:catechol 2,3-dioxygenase-like lactoylglutathione lyase family enzyme|uniref:VOC family protein n=1 Tax=Ilumatobacter sp. TaxID=1967498 RepID=UPI00391956F8
MAVIDHLVYFVPRLDTAIDWFDDELGVRPSIGGSHPGMGTHNALVSLGDCYLELLAPDPEQPEPSAARPFGIDELSEPRLVTFAVRPSQVESLGDVAEAMRRVGHDPGPATTMSRRTPAGVELQWTLTLPTLAADGFVPFLIDWGTTPNPATSAPGGVRLFDLMGTTPHHEFANAVLDAIGLEEMATHGTGGLSAILDGAIGTVPLVL